MTKATKATKVTKVNLTTGLKYVAMSTEELTKYNKTTCINAKTLKNRIQIGSVAILMHVGKHGNKPQACKLANDLVNGLGQGIQCGALIDWFIEFGMVVGDDGKAFADIDLDKVKANFQKAKATHWSTFAPVTPWSGFSLQDKLEALLKAAGKAQDKAREDDLGELVDIDDIKLSALSLVANMDSTQLSQLLKAGGVEEPTTPSEPLQEGENPAI